MVRSLCLGEVLERSLLLKYCGRALVAFLLGHVVEKSGRKAVQTGTVGYVGPLVRNDHDDAMEGVHAVRREVPRLVEAFLGEWWKALRLYIEIIVVDH